MVLNQEQVILDVRVSGINSDFRLGRTMCLGMENYQENLRIHMIQNILKRKKVI